MRVSPVYPLVLALPPGAALGVGTYVLTGSPGLGVIAGLGVGLGLLALILIGTELGSTDRELAPGER